MRRTPPAFCAGAGVARAAARAIPPIAVTISRMCIAIVPNRFCLERRIGAIRRAIARLSPPVTCDWRWAGIRAGSAPALPQATGIPPITVATAACATGAGWEGADPATYGPSATHRRRQRVADGVGFEPTVSL